MVTLSCLVTKKQKFKIRNLLKVEFSSHKLPVSVINWTYVSRLLILIFLRKATQGDHILDCCISLNSVLFLVFKEIVDMCHILLKGRLFAQISWNGLHFSFHSKRKIREANYFKITEFHEHIQPWSNSGHINFKTMLLQNALNCISTAHKSLFECMIKRNKRGNWSQITCNLGRCLAQIPAHSAISFFFEFFSFEFFFSNFKTNFNCLRKSVTNDTH